MPTYVITGANRGIGLEYVRQLSPDTSNTIFALVRNPSGISSDLKSFSEKDNVHIVECDVSSTDSISKLSLPQGTKINYLINNAGIQKSGKEVALKLDADLLRQHVDTNVIGPAKVTEQLLSYLAPNAIIANITSGMGSLKLLSDGSIPPHIPSYSISKAALNMLTVHQAYELKGKAVVVCVDPGHVMTDMGGPSAPLAIDKSASSILKKLHSLQEGDSGKFFLYDGSDVPW